MHPANDVASAVDAVLTNKKIPDLEPYGNWRSCFTRCFTLPQPQCGCKLLR